MKQSKRSVPTLTPEQFDKLKKIDQYKVIAKDALSQIAAKKYKGKRGNYARSDRSIKFEPDSDVRELLLSKNPTCTVCAKGALFLSQIRLADKIKFPSAEDLLKYNRRSLNSDTGRRTCMLNNTSADRSMRTRSAETHFACLDPVLDLVFPKTMSNNIEDAFEGDTFKFGRLIQLIKSDTKRLIAILTYVAENGTFSTRDYNKLVAITEKN